MDILRRLFFFVTNGDIMINIVSYPHNVSHGDNMLLDRFFYASLARCLIMIGDILIFTGGIYGDYLGTYYPLPN